MRRSAQALVASVLLFATSNALAVGAWLGVRLADAPGVARVAEVIPGTPAQEAGLAAGDRIVSLAGSPVRDRTELVRRVARLTAGRDVSLEVERAGSPLAFVVTLAARPEAVQALRKLHLGRIAPAFRVARWYTDGGPVPPELASRVLLVEFWATWCGPCRVARPRLALAHRALSPRGLSVVAITSEAAPVVDAYVRSLGKLPYLIGRDDRQRTSSAFAVSAFPTYFLVDRKGVIRRVGVGNGDLDGLLREAHILLDEP